MMKTKQILLAAVSFFVLVGQAYAGGGPFDPVTEREEEKKPVTPHRTSAGPADDRAEEERATQITVRKEGQGLLLEMAGGVLTAASVGQAGADLLHLDEENTTPLVIRADGITAVEDPALWGTLVKRAIRLGSLVGLSLKNCHLTDAAVDPVLRELQKCQGLAQLDLSGNPDLTDKSGALIKELVARPDSKLRVQEINFSGTGISTREHPAAQKVGASDDMVTAIRQEQQRVQRADAQQHLHGAVTALGAALTGDRGAPTQLGDHLGQAFGAFGGLLKTWTKR